MKYLSIICLLGVSLLPSCKKFLEQQPSSNEAHITKAEQIAQLLTSAYPKASYITLTESMSDNVSDKGTGTDEVANKYAYLFEEINATADDQDSPQLYWASCYEAIASANHALDLIKNSPDSADLKGYKGEALVARAYAHFMLVSLFSQFYDEAHAGTDMGIPYVDEPENVVNKKYERKTVAYVYQRIEEDLLQGLPLIEDKNYTVPKYHFNRAAANAFASRFYLYLKKYDKVEKYASDAFPNNDFANYLRPWNTTPWTAYGAADLRNEYTKASLPANLLLIEAASLWGRYNYTYRYGYLYPTLASFWSIRGICGNPNWVFQQKLYGSTTHFYIPKIGEYFVRASINANYGYPYTMVPVFDAEEVLLNRAEARVYLNKHASAIDDLNTYVSKRALNYNPTNHAVTETKILNFFPLDTKDSAYVKSILAIRRLEFMFQGLRWFDMQRYKMPVKHYTIDNSGDTPKADSIVLEARHNRRVLQLPASVKLSGLELNPR